MACPLKLIVVFDPDVARHDGAIGTAVVAATPRPWRFELLRRRQRGGTANAGTCPGHQGCLDESRHVQGIYQQNTVASIRIRRET